MDLQNHWCQHQVQSPPLCSFFVGKDLRLVLGLVFSGSCVQSPVLGESVSMYSPSDDNLNFYKDLMVKDAQLCVSHYWQVFVCLSVCLSVCVHLSVCWGQIRAPNCSSTRGQPVAPAAL